MPLHYIVLIVSRTKPIHLLGMCDAQTGRERCMRTLQKRKSVHWEEGTDVTVAVYIFLKLSLAILQVLPSIVKWCHLYGQVA